MITRIATANKAFYCTKQTFISYSYSYNTFRYALFV